MKKSATYWIPSVACFVIALLHFPSFSSFLFLLAGVLFLPVELVRDKIAFYCSPPVKISIIIVAVLVGFALLPQNSKPSNSADSPTGFSTAASMAVSENKTAVLQPTATPVVIKVSESPKYSENETINSLLIEYNKIAEYPFTADMLSDSTRSNRASGSCNDVWVQLSVSGAAITVDFRDESSSDEQIKPLYRDFYRVLNPSLTTEQFEDVWADLKLEKDHEYLGNEYYSVNCLYSSQKLNNGGYRYVTKLTLFPDNSH